jgi:hypothetical protein
MQVAPYDGLEAYNGSGLEVVPGGHLQHQKVYPIAGSSEAVPPRKRICGLSRAVFWLAVAITILALTMIGVGAGLGVALSKANANNGGEFHTDE